MFSLGLGLNSRASLGGVNFGLNLSHPLAGNVQVAYAFNEGSGTAVRDVSGKARHGRLGSIGPATALFTSATGYITNNHLEGIAFDGTNWFLSDTDGLYKTNGSFTVLSHRPVVTGDLPTTSPARNHVGDISVYNGKIYAPVEYWNGTIGVSNAVGLWNTSDLSFASYMDVSSIFSGADLAAIEVDPANNCIWAVSFVDNLLRKLNLTTGALLATFTVPVTGYQFQSLALRNNVLYIGTNRASDNSAMIFGLDLTKFTITRQYYQNVEVDALAFNGSTLVLGTASGGDPSVLTLNSGPVDLTPNWTGNGYQFDSNVWACAVPWQRSDAGSMVSGIIPATLYSFNGIWDQAPDQNNWESWVSSTGEIDARIGVDSSRRQSATGVIAAGSAYQHTFCWDRTGAITKQYVNGALSPTGDGTIPSWVTPPLFLWLGNVQSGNTKSTMLFQYFFAFDKVLSDTEAASLAANPYGLFNRKPR